MMSVRRVVWVCAGIWGLALPACDEEDEDDGAPACIEFEVTACTPQYPPEFDRVFTETLQPTCAAAAGACHGQAESGGAKGGMHVSDVDATYDALVEGGFVIPGDPACSPLMVRLNTDDSNMRMPPGLQPLDEHVRCSIAQWIAEGAER